MSKTVYIEVVSNYSRSDWDNSGTTTYDPGDRVAYFDGSRNRIFVCINSNNSTTEPQNNLTDWAPAGSEKYPFLNIDSTNNLGQIGNSEWIVHGRPSDTVNFLAEELGTWTADNPIGSNAVYHADGQGGTIILGDGRYSWTITTYAKWFPNNCTIQAKRKQKAYIITSGNYWGGDNVTWKDVVFYCSNTDNNIPGCYGGFTHNIDSCLFTQETPWGSLNAIKQEPSKPAWTRVCNSFNGGYIKNCTFDYQYRGPSYWFDLPSSSTGICENNTFYARVKHNQYHGIYGSANIVFKNNIFYYKYLMDGHVTQNFSRMGQVTEGVNIVYLENDSDVGGTINNNLSAGVTINPKFIDVDNSNFSLRPNSPLIGGINNSTEQLKMESEYPQGKWFDSSAADGGDGAWDTPYNNYGEAINSFTGDEAVVLIKEGQHPLLEGFWSGSSWGTGNDLSKVYLDGVKLIGMGEKCIFTAGQEVSTFPAFYNSSYNVTANPNLIDTPFLLKDFTILLTSPSPYNRSLWSLRKGTMINIHVRPTGPSLGNSGSNLFDYNMNSGTGDYLHMTSCSIEVTFEGTYGDFCSAAGEKQFSSCTFIDPNHTRTGVNYPKNFLHNSAGNVAGSLIKDCIFYTKSSGFNNTGASTTLCQLLNTAFYSTQDELTLSSGTNKTNCAVVDPGFINDNGYEETDLRLRADSPLIGGIKKEESNVYYLQPGNPYNGDGSQKDASNMTADGEPGPFNDFNKILAAGVPYGSKIIILNGTYPWPDAFHVQKTQSNWADYTYEGYSYHAETPNQVIFDGNLQLKTLGHYTLGGAAGSGTHIDLHTSFNGVQFNRSLRGQAWPHNTTAIYGTTDSLGKGSLTFNSCKFLGWIMGSGYNWSGGGRYGTSSGISWNGCTISIAWESDNGSLFGGQDKLADDSISVGWSWTNCVFYSPHGETTFYGNNAPNGTYFGPSQIFSTTGMQSSRIFKGNILYVPGGTTTIAGTNTVDKWPQISNNALVGVDIDATEQSLLDANNNLIDVDPLFVDPSNNNFSLRPLSPLIGQG